MFTYSNNFYKAISQTKWLPVCVKGFIQPCNKWMWRIFVELEFLYIFLKCNVYFICGCLVRSKLKEGLFTAVLHMLSLSASMLDHIHGNEYRKSHFLLTWVHGWDRKNASCWQPVLVCKAFIPDPTFIISIEAMGTPFYSTADTVMATHIWPWPPWAQWICQGALGTYNPIALGTQTWFPH